MFIFQLALAFLIWIGEFLGLWFVLSRRTRFSASSGKAGGLALALLACGFLALVGGYFVLLSLHAVQKDHITWPGFVVLVIIGSIFVDSQIFALRILLDSIGIVTGASSQASEDESQENTPQKPVEPSK